VPFQVGDISRRGGGPFPPHSAHQNGNEADLRPFRRDGEMAPCSHFDLEYDQDATREFIEMVHERNPRAIVLFNDPQLVYEGHCRYYGGHDNHLHVRLPLAGEADEPAECSC
jgi:conjugal transfer mating pair stabilization protein TraG